MTGTTTESAEPSVLRVSALTKAYGPGTSWLSRFANGRAGTLKALDGVDLHVRPGEILALVGESGSGKSTIGKAVLGLQPPTSGTVRVHGHDITRMSLKQRSRQVADLRVVFQDPYSSLNPRMTIGQIVGEPMRLHGTAKGAALDTRVDEMLEKCGLRSELRDRFPHEMSGGQRQRVGLARALAVEPSLVIADEPVSALDVSVQASILNLITDLQRDLGFSCLFITHDLSVVEYISDTIAVMYLGKVVERTSREQLFRDPQMPYTQSLLTAAPVPDPAAQRARTRVVLRGDLPSPLDPPPGCHFHTRCPVAVDRCRVEVPPLAGVTAPDHLVACHLVDPETGAPGITAAAAQRS
jgi:peptide/nickel transport system ATP-binding protein